MASGRHRRGVRLRQIGDRLSILRLVPEPGRILLGPASPMTSLNLVLTVGHQIKEAIAVHRRFTPQPAGERVIPMLERVRVLAPKQHAVCFPRELSGGMRQRTMIAMGLSNESSLLIADEPTAALDLAVQAQMIELLRDLNREIGTAIVLITHDLAVVASLGTHMFIAHDLAVVGRDVPGPGRRDRRFRGPPQTTAPPLRRGAAERDPHRPTRTWRNGAG